MNPWLLLGALAIWIGTAGGAYFRGHTDGVNGEIAKAKAADDVRRETLDTAMQGAADAISKIQVRNTTVKGKVETITREIPVYRDCRHDPDGLRQLNAALTGGEPEPAGGGQLPAADATRR